VEEVFKGLKKAGQKVTQKQAAQWIRDAAEDETATELNLEQFLALMTKRGKSGGSFTGWFGGGKSEAVGGPPDPSESSSLITDGEADPGGSPASRSKSPSRRQSAGDAVSTRGPIKDCLFVGSFELGLDELMCLPAHRVFFRINDVQGPIDSAVGIHIRGYDPDATAGKIGKLCAELIGAPKAEQVAGFDALTEMLSDDHDSFDVLEYKKTMIEQAAPEEAIGALLHEETAPAAARLLGAILTFPPKLTESNDICQARKALQHHMCQVGVLSALEEASYREELTPSAWDVAAVVFGNGRRALIAAMSPYPRIFELLVQGVNKEHEGARNLLELINLESKFPPHLFDLYEFHRFSLPPIPSLWRSPCLKDMPDETTDELTEQWEAERAKGKARDAHLLEFGVPPAQVRIQKPLPNPDELVDLETTNHCDYIDVKFPPLPKDDKHDTDDDEDEDGENDKKGKKGKKKKNAKQAKPKAKRGGGGDSGSEQDTS
jgi:hypothetical protein